MRSAHPSRAFPSIKDLEKAARADSTDAAAHSNLALGYRRAKRWEDAEGSLRAALRFDPAPDVTAEFGRRLAGRAVEVRWGRGARERLLTASDPDVQGALALFPRLAEILRPR